MSRKPLNLSPEQQEQIKSMRQEGNSYAQVIQFFQQNYEIKLNSSLIRKIGGKAGKRGRKPKIALPAKAETSARTLICQAYQLHKQDFLKLVQETIEAV